MGRNSTVNDTQEGGIEMLLDIVEIDILAWIHWLKYIVNKTFEKIPITNRFVKIKRLNHQSVTTVSHLFTLG